MSGNIDQSIGKVGVDIRFLFRKSEWGTLGTVENPAGIIYMQLDFHQPSDCVLESATIQVTLDEDDPSLRPYLKDDLPGSECPILITDYYGPGQIVGPSKTMSVYKSVSFEPQVSVADIGLSLGHMSKDTSFKHESRWIFQSHTVPDDQARVRKWGHRILKWEMTENDIEKYPIHSNKVLTAFAYEHNGQPFLMKVKVSGKLRHWSDQLKYQTRKSFRPRARKQEDVSTTLVGAYTGYRRPLDQDAQGLSKAMEIQNYKLAKNLTNAMAVQDGGVATQTVPLQQNADAVSSENIATRQDFASSASDQEFTGGKTRPRRDLDLDGETLNTPEDIREPAKEDRTAPTLENLARVGAYYRAPPRREVVRSDVSEASEDSSAPTLVADGSGTLQQSAPQPKNPDEEAIARMMEVTFLRLLIRNWLALWIFLGLGKPLELSNKEQATATGEGLKGEETES